MYAVRTITCLSLFRISYVSESSTFSRIWTHIHVRCSCHNLIFLAFMTKNHGGVATWDAECKCWCKFNFQNRFVSANGNDISEFLIWKRIACSHALLFRNEHWRTRHFQNVTVISILFRSACLKMTSGFLPLLSHSSTGMMIMAMATAKCVEKRSVERACVRLSINRNTKMWMIEMRGREILREKYIWWRRRRLNEERAWTVLVDNGSSCYLCYAKGNGILMWCDANRGKTKPCNTIRCDMRRNDMGTIICGHIACVCPTRNAVAVLLAL